jgi:hypothetical protein
MRRFALLVAVLLAAFPGCRCAGGGPAEPGPDGSAAPGELASAPAMPSAVPEEEPADREDDASEPSGDASIRFRDAAPKVDRDLEGPADPACTGAELAFAVAVVDARCAISSARARKLRALLERDGGLGLRQDAKVTADGRVALRLVNKSGTSLSLPLSFHGKLPAFSVLAEDERHTIYELESPELDLRDRGEGSRSHFARIVLPPEGAAVATVKVSPTILRVLGRGATDPCRSSDAGACGATKLGKGHYVLHVGELLTDVEAGPPARVEIDLP